MGSKSLRYFSLFHLDDAQRNSLQALGYSPDVLETASKDSQAFEMACLAENGYAGLALAPDNEMPFFQQSMLFAGYIFFRCPKCQAATKSNHSFAFLHHRFHQHVFYRFDCCGEFYLITGDSPQRKIGMYGRRDGVAVNFISYPSGPAEAEEPYTEKHFYAWCKRLDEYLRFNEEKVRRYLSWQGKRKTMCLLGFVGNIAHHLFDEVVAVESVVHDYQARYIDEYIVGDRDYFGIDKLFAGLEFTKGTLLATRAGISIEPAIFHHVLDNNGFAFRLSSTAALPDTLANRIISSSEETTGADMLRLINDARAHFPLILVTLRSHGRAWQSQRSGIANVLNKLYEQYPGLGVVFDGVEHERETLAAVTGEMRYSIEYYDILNVSRLETVVWANAVDCFLSPLGAGATFTTITNKPGVFHTNRKFARQEPFCPLPRENGVLSVSVAPAERAAENNVYTGNYEVDWEDVYEALVALVGRLPPR